MIGGPLNPLGLSIVRPTTTPASAVRARSKQVAVAHRVVPMRHESR